MSNIKVIVPSLSICTKHPGEPMNIGMVGVAINVRKLHQDPDNIIHQPAFKLAGYPEVIQGNNVGVLRDTTKYNYDAIIIND